MDSLHGESPPLVTDVLHLDPAEVAKTFPLTLSALSLENASLTLQDGSPEAESLRRAARELRETDVPVAFPTETVYGLGADVTRSSAVLGIFKAKQRPSDNPLIVHISSLRQLRSLLDPDIDQASLKPERSDPACERTPSFPRFGISSQHQHKADPIPVIYQPLIEKFWPGPLTLIMTNPSPSVLAPEVTAGLQTFGVRMPSSVVALALINLAGVPLAAPSANASSKPSPTTAAHVKHDLEGRISTIIDGGQCEVGVESTVVDGLASPPLILRPGGISIDQLRSCPGWEDVAVGYHDVSEPGSKPKAPGMKYKHYSPRARVILYEFDQAQPDVQDIAIYGRSIGLIRTSAWRSLDHSRGSRGSEPRAIAEERDVTLSDSMAEDRNGESYDGASDLIVSKARKFEIFLDRRDEALEVWDIDLGSSSSRVARGLFSALRELDSEGVDAILVEGIDSARGGVAAAVMNRLRKAAETNVKLL